MESIEAAQQALEENFAPWVRALRPTVTEIGPERAVMEIPITDHVMRVGGIISGQALAALADTTMVFACAGHFGELKPVATTNLDTQFLRAGKGEAIRCEARVVRAGRQVLFAKAEMSALPGHKLVASATATFYLP
ncbi:hotdog fold thioesterase [Aquicoccus sp. SCR17]|nr:hotdog fold thioesterase [Carideicomes alvinocaridis]